MGDNFLEPDIISNNPIPIFDSKATMPGQKFARPLVHKRFLHSWGFSNVPYIMIYIIGCSILVVASPSTLSKVREETTFFTFFFLFFVLLWGSLRARKEILLCLLSHPLQQLQTWVVIPDGLSLR